MGDSGAGDKKAQIDLACSTAENFSKLFYDKMDNKRHTIAKMYLETATASWNGNKVDGSVDIQKFYLDKLPKTEHNVTSLDAQPVGAAFVGSQTTILVSVAGNVSFQGQPLSQPPSSTFIKASFVLTLRQKIKFWPKKVLKHEIAKTTQVLYPASAPCIS